MATVMTPYAYDYEEKKDHLDADEALKVFLKERMQNDALVVLEDLKCGHWNVKVLRTDREKEEYLKERITGIWKKVINGIQMK